jgi:hypothetical protein
MIAADACRRGCSWAAAVPAFSGPIAGDRLLFAAVASSTPRSNCNRPANREQGPAPAGTTTDQRLLLWHACANTTTAAQPVWGGRPAARGRSREAQNTSRRAQRASSSDSQGVSERSERCERSEFRSATRIRASQGTRAQRGQAVGPTGGCPASAAPMPERRRVQSSTVRNAPQPAAATRRAVGSPSSAFRFVEPRVQQPSGFEGPSTRRPLCRTRSAT